MLLTENYYLQQGKFAYCFWGYICRCSLIIGVAVDVINSVSFIMSGDDLELLHRSLVKRVVSLKFCYIRLITFPVCQVNRCIVLNNY